MQIIVGKHVEACILGRREGGSHPAVTEEENTMPEVKPGPSETVLAQLPARALTFLSTLGRSVPIRAALAERGYTDDDHEEGWSFLHDVSAYRSPTVTSKTTAPAVRAAQTTVDAWDEPTFRIIRATLERRFPEQEAFVMGGLAASTGDASVVGVKTLLDRLDELENGKDRKATRKEDHGALAILAKKGIDKAERARLRELVQTASRKDMPEAEEELEARKKARTEGPDKSTEAHAAALLKLHAWYREWSETARSVITRRDYLIRLGLAKRKGRKGEGPAPE